MDFAGTLCSGITVFVLPQCRRNTPNGAVWKFFRRQGINNRDSRGFDRNRDFGPRINDRIRVREVRVIDEIGGQLGIMTPREALDIARGKGLDLIEVAPNANPPVCRIMDYGKYKYEQGKREREAAKKQRQSEMKGMTLRPGTDDHDLDIKIKNILRFLAEGDKVKVTIRFRSREMSHPEFAYASMNKISSSVQAAGVGTIERAPLMEGRQMIMILSPVRDSGATKKPATAAPKPAANGTEAKAEGEPKPAPAPAPIVEAPVAETVAAEA